MCRTLIFLVLLLAIIAMAIATETRTKSKGRGKNKINYKDKVGGLLKRGLYGHPSDCYDHGNVYGSDHGQSQGWGWGWSGTAHFGSLDYNPGKGHAASWGHGPLSNSIYVGNGWGWNDNKKNNRYSSDADGKGWRDPSYGHRHHYGNYYSPQVYGYHI